jgi:hypothetical protein
MAEMRWQIWEGLRLNVKGMFFFVLLSQGQGYPKAKLPEEEDPGNAYLRPILVKTATRVGCDALLDPKGNPTPEGSKMFTLYHKLTPHKSLLWALTLSNTPWVTADGGTQISSLVDSTTGKQYAIAVNPDFGAAHVVTLTTTMNTRGLMDVLASTRLKLAPLGTGGTFGTKIRLEAGDGVMLKIEQDR